MITSLAPRPEMAVPRGPKPSCVPGDLDWKDRDFLARFPSCSICSIELVLSGTTVRTVDVM